jgi:tRNA-binding protein
MHTLKISGSTLIVNPSLRSLLEPMQVERMVTRETIEWSDFERVELRAGTVVEARAFPEARKPAYRLRIDFGPEVGVLQSSAQITDCYQPDDLVGRQVLAVVNFPPKQIGPMRSECLVTGLHREDGAVVLGVPDAPVPNGARLA